MSRKPDFQKNQKVDNYILEEPLGAGQDGEVWRATRVSIKKSCAIKFLNSVKEDGKKTRFEREIEILAALDHPHIIQIQDRGEAWNPNSGEIVPYYVMEFLPGKTIQRVIEQLPRDQILDTFCILFLQILAALDAAHQLGISHGDIKPANIMVLQDEDVMIAKLSDFGFGLRQGDSSELREEYPESSYRAPAGLTPGQADIYRFGRTLLDCGELTASNFDHRVADRIESLAKRLLEEPANTTLTDIKTLIEQIRRSRRSRENNSLEDMARSVPELLPSPKSAKVIYDPVHGAYQLSSPVIALVDQDIFQRLRRIKEYPSCELVFPALSISSFEQVLGEHSMLITLLKHFTQEDNFRAIAEPVHLNSVILANLLIGCGKSPFRFSLARAIPDVGWPAFRLVYEILSMAPIIDDINKFWDVDVEMVKQLVSVPTDAIETPALRIMSALLHGPLSGSTIEWVNRTPARAGFHQSVDIQRLVRGLTVSPEEGEIIVREPDLVSILDFHRAKQEAVERIFMHHVVRAADLMLSYSFQKLHEDGFDFTKLLLLDDANFMRSCILRAKETDSNSALELFNNYGKRILHKRVLSFNSPDWPHGLYEAGRAVTDQIGAILGDMLGQSIEPGKVLVDVEPFIPTRIDILVKLRDGRIVPAPSISPNLYGLEKLEDKPNSVIYAAPELKTLLAGREQEIESRILDFLNH